MNEKFNGSGIDLSMDGQPISRAESGDVGAAELDMESLLRIGRKVGVFVSERAVEISEDN